MSRGWWGRRCLSPPLFCLLSYSYQASVGLCYPAKEMLFDRQRVFRSNYKNILNRMDIHLWWNTVEESWRVIPLKVNVTRVIVLQTGSSRHKECYLWTVIAKSNACHCIPISRPTDATCDRFSIYMCITLHVSSVKRSSSEVPHRSTVRDSWWWALDTRNM
jgi:hypothetical protein